MMRASHTVLLVMGLIYLLHQTSGQHACTGGDFRCGVGECIPLDWKCDGHPDCNNGDDELDCSESAFRCGSRQFHCGNHMCIPQDWVCDDDDDCDDRRDESRTECQGRNPH